VIRDGSLRGPATPAPVVAGGRPAAGDARPDRLRQRVRFFEAEVARLLDRLYGAALRLTRSETDAEDLVAEALAKAWARLDSLQDPQAFEKWVFRILANTFISDWRRGQVRPVEVSVHEFEAGDDGDADTFSLFEQVHQPFLLWWGNPEQELVDKLLRQDIERALDGLPDAFRTVVVLVEVQGLSYDEVARALDVPAGTVRSRLNRGRAMLQRSLWQQASQLGIAVGGPRGDTP
jgi:RNA polymerase sigma-70 factor, ECF subfamily